jgi:hypothetical protein
MSELVSVGFSMKLAKEYNVEYCNMSDMRS